MDIKVLVSASIRYFDCCNYEFLTHEKRVRGHVNVVFVFVQDPSWRDYMGGDLSSSHETTEPVASKI